MLKGKSAVVTGSTSGIGMGIAALAAQGANVMLNGFGDANEIKTFRVRLEREHGVKAVHSSADMRSPVQIHAMIAEAERIFGAVDILVNNAGIQHVAPVDEFPQDKWDAIIAKDFVKIDEVAGLTVFLCTDAAASITGSPISIDGGWVAQ